jgi:hypothetical protein
MVRGDLSYTRLRSQVAGKSESGAPTYRGKTHRSRHTGVLEYIRSVGCILHFWKPGRNKKNSGGPSHGVNTWTRQSGKYMYMSMGFRSVKILKCGYKDYKDNKDYKDYSLSRR